MRARGPVFEALRERVRRRRQIEKRKEREADRERAPECRARGEFEAPQPALLAARLGLEVRPLPLDPLAASSVGNAAGARGRTEREERVAQCQPDPLQLALLHAEVAAVGGFFAESCGEPRALHAHPLAERAVILIPVFVVEAFGDPIRDESDRKHRELQHLIRRVLGGGRDECGDVECVQKAKRRGLQLRREFARAIAQRCE